MTDFRDFEQILNTSNGTSAPTGTLASNFFNNFCRVGAAALANTRSWAAKRYTPRAERPPVSMRLTCRACSQIQATGMELKRAVSLFSVFEDRPASEEEEKKKKKKEER